MTTKRPNTLQGETHRIETNAGRLFVTINFHEEKPFEVFLRVGKHGGDLGAFVSSIARFISQDLRQGHAIPKIIKKLETADHDALLPTVPDAVAQILALKNKGT